MLRTFSIPFLHVLTISRRYCTVNWPKFSHRKEKDGKETGMRREMVKDYFGKVYFSTSEGDEVLTNQFVKTPFDNVLCQPQMLTW